MRRVAGLVAAALALSALHACGGDDQADRPLDPAEIARQQVEAANGGSTSGVTAVPSTLASASSTDVVATELPPPDAGGFIGANRVVNLWAGPDGSTQVVDVWARRSLTNGPVLLAEDVAFGSATAYFAAPPNQEIAIVGADAGPDGIELAGVVAALIGEQITTVFTNADDAGTASATTTYERSNIGGGPPPSLPEDGNGLVYLLAPNTVAFESALNLAIGAASFVVGDGAGTCVRQRIEDDGFAPSVLGGAQHVELELPPGATTLTLHASESADGCAQPSLLDIPVEVVAGSGSLVLVYSRDATTIESLVLPMPLS